MSGTKWEPVPRIYPEYLARWEDWSGRWRLVVTDRWWNPIDSATTDVLVSDPHPGDEWIGKLTFRKSPFIPLDGAGWERDGRAWQRPVCPVHAEHA